MATTEMRMVQWTIGVSMLEHRINEDNLEEARVVLMAMVMGRRWLEWFGHVKRRNETENIRAVAEVKIGGRGGTALAYQRGFITNIYIYIYVRPADQISVM